MPNGYIIDVSTSVDIHEIFENGRIVIETNEGVLYGEKFKVSPFKEVSDKLFESREKDKDENIFVWQILVKLNMNNLCSGQIDKDIDESYSCNLRRLDDDRI